MICNLENEFITALKNKCYGLAECDIKRIERISSSRSFYDLSMINSDSATIEICGDFGDKITIKTQCRSQVIDPPPLVSDNTLIKMYPVIILSLPINTEGFNHVLFHELSHLYSIGEYTKFDVEQGLYSHKYGINRFIYRQSDIYLVKEKGEENNTLNENVNDFVADRLLEKITGEHYYSTPVYMDFKQKITVLLEKFGISVDKFIGMYFRDDLQVINLLKEINKNKQ